MLFKRIHLVRQLPIRRTGSAEFARQDRFVGLPHDPRAAAEAVNHFSGYLARRVLCPVPVLLKRTG